MSCNLNSKGNENTNYFSGIFISYLKNIGICKESEYKYDDNNRNDNYNNIPKSIKENALKHRIKSYAKVNTIDGLKNDLYFNGPCLIAFPV